MLSAIDLLLNHLFYSLQTTTLVGLALQASGAQQEVVDEKLEKVSDKIRSFPGQLLNLEYLSCVREQKHERANLQHPTLPKEAEICTSQKNW